jgi:hypothetical protein
MSNPVSSPCRPRSRTAPLARAFPVGLVCLALLAASARGQASGGCAPAWRQFFDFQVGDVFQIRITDYTFPPGVRPNVDTLRQYQVVSRRDSASARVYVFRGREKRIQSYFGQKDPVSVEYADYAETRVYRDTVNDPLAGCPGAIVRMPDMWPPDVLYTRVKAAAGDTSLFPLARPGLRMKAYGRELGELKDTALLQIADVDRLATYAEGLGLVSGFKGGYDAASSRYSLIGYVKDGDTVGTVSADSAFRRPVGLRMPAPASARGTGAMGRITSPDFDARGRRLPAESEVKPAPGAVPRFRR